MTMATHTNNDLFTASDVARFCSVDLKTIHNWADRNHIKFFRTPGRHLRFRRLDVLEFLRKFGYPIPAEVQQLDAPGAHGKPRVMLVEPDSTRIPQLIEKLGDLFEVQTRTNTALALMAIGEGEVPPEAVVFKANEPYVLEDFSKVFAKSDRYAKIRVLIAKDDIDELKTRLLEELKDELKLSV